MLGAGAGTSAWVLLRLPRGTQGKGFTLYAEFRGFRGRPPRVEPSVDALASRRRPCASPGRAPLVPVICDEDRIAKAAFSVRDAYVREKHNGVKLGRSTYAIFTDAGKASRSRTRSSNKYDARVVAGLNHELVGKEVVAVVEVRDLGVAGGAETKDARGRLALWMVG